MRWLERIWNECVGDYNRKKMGREWMRRKRGMTETQRKYAGKYANGKFEKAKKYSEFVK